jgi:hypothetical protein
MSDINGLTHRPFEKMIPLTLKGPGFDLGPAYKALENMPVGYRKKENVEKRVNRAKELLIANGTLKHQEVDAILRNEFGGAGISKPKFNQLRANLTRRQRDEERKKEKQMQAQEKKESATPEQLRAYAADRLRASPSILLGDKDGGLQWLMMQRFGYTLPMAELETLWDEINENERKAIAALRCGATASLARGTRTMAPMVPVAPATNEVASVESALKIWIKALFKEQPDLVGVTAVKADGAEPVISYQVREVVTKEIKK